jgi:3-keto-disaccharide hydrolase
MKSIAITLTSLLLTFTAARAAENWQPLWDGKTFNGWHIIGKGQWRIEDGAIHGTNVKTAKEFGHLVTDKSFKDFAVRLKYRAVKGNSGLYFRIEEKGYSGVSGFQAEIDAEHDVGGLYETNGRAWVSKPAEGDVKKWFKPGEWNEMTVSAHGGHIVVRVNGQKSAEVFNDPGRRDGKFALQVHAGQDVDVWFKDIEIRKE